MCMPCIYKPVLCGWLFFITRYFVCIAFKHSAMIFGQGIPYNEVIVAYVRKFLQRFVPLPHDHWIIFMGCVCVKPLLTVGEVTILCISGLFCFTYFV